jgi:hypothetical protein
LFFIFSLVLLQVIDNDLTKKILGSIFTPLSFPFLR